MMRVETEIIHETNRLWGFEYMTGLCMEEFAEVVQAINKVRRRKSEGRDMSDVVDHLNEELADCLICYFQLKDLGICDDAGIKKWVEYKQNRQAKRNLTGIDHE